MNKPKAPLNPTSLRTRTYITNELQEKRSQDYTLRDLIDFVTGKGRDVIFIASEESTPKHPITIIIQDGRTDVQENDAGQEYYQKFANANITDHMYASDNPDGIPVYLITVKL